ncbi:type I-E CRISPR-associated protein Cas6/Cse3/CasE [Actinomycetota bacterium Odt1-20B]
MGTPVHRSWFGTHAHQRPPARHGTRLSRFQRWHRKTANPAGTQFDGTARVNDGDLLLEKLTAGIGRGKAYGCGLLGIAPAR